MKPSISTPSFSTALNSKTDESVHPCSNTSDPQPEIGSTSLLHAETTAKFLLEEQYINVDNAEHVRLYYIKVTPQNMKTKASILIVHGFGEHCERWLRPAEALASQGYVVHMYDQRGYGYSGGARFMTDMTQFHNDLALMIRQCEQKLPLFIMGHSMGGLILTSFLLHNPTLRIAGAITSSALFTVQKGREVDFMKVLLMRGASKAFPELIVNSMINPCSLSKELSIVKTVTHDPKIIPVTGPVTAFDIVISNLYFLERCKEFNYPILLTHGDSDSVTEHRSSIEFYERMKSSDKLLKIIRGAYHEPMQDVEHSEFIDHVVEFMDSRYEVSPPIGLLPSNLIYGRLARRRSWKRLFLRIVLLPIIIRLLMYICKLRRLPIGRLVGSILYLLYTGLVFLGSELLEGRDPI